MNTNFLVILFLLVLYIPGAAQSHPLTAAKVDQFDFWIGVWDVNLKMVQKDGLWEDKIRSVAHIREILGGKAILELWNESESGIIGHSIRYYNPNKDKWDLFLNWPGKNTSGTNNMEGSFRHGRGEFSRINVSTDSLKTISRYTFSDISPQSLRWDDGYSTDGGLTWKPNWIMEFFRTQDLPPSLSNNYNLHTYYHGNRCDQEEFKKVQQIVGEYSLGSEQLMVYNILDGCSVMGLSESLYFKFTYNTYASLYELTVMDSNQENPLWIYYGEKNADAITLTHRENEQIFIAKIIAGNTVKIEINYAGKDYVIE